MNMPQNRDEIKKSSPNLNHCGDGPLGHKIATKQTNEPLLQYRVHRPDSGKAFRNDLEAFESKTREMKKMTHMKVAEGIKESTPC